MPAKTSKKLNGYILPRVSYYKEQLEISTYQGEQGMISLEPFCRNHKCNPELCILLIGKSIVSFVRYFVVKTVKFSDFMLSIWAKCILEEYRWYPRCDNAVYSLFISMKAFFHPLPSFAAHPSLECTQARNWDDSICNIVERHTWIAASFKLLPLLSFCVFLALHKQTKTWRRRN